MTGPDPTATPMDGVWMSWYTDGSGVHPHPNEVEALRAAVESSRTVTFVLWGETLGEALYRERTTP